MRLRPFDQFRFQKQQRSPGFAIGNCTLTYESVQCAPRKSQELSRFLNTQELYWCINSCLKHDPLHSCVGCVATVCKRLCLRKIFLICVEEDQWQRLVELMGHPDWAREEIFKDRVAAVTPDAQPVA